jgi:hypothetical protein
MGRLFLMDRTSPEAAGRCLERVTVCWDHLARVAACRSPRRANVLASWMLMIALKGPTSPTEGPDVSLFSSFLTFYSI